ncbi:hypothetical protein [Actinoplanes sp. NPDC049681]|uniref:hypothetical protein n=1 Tax=Actinoplanes sp. NPDC049681 TaxID=3363905 RepID=UPI0037B0028A
MRIVKTAGALAISLLLAATLTACGGQKRFAITKPCDALTDEELIDQTNMKMTRYDGKVIDPTISVCEWNPANEPDYAVRLRTQDSTKLLEVESTINGREELPKLGEGGFQGLSLDGAVRTIESSWHGRSFSVECRLKAVNWNPDGCLRLAELVLRRMPE